MQVLAVSLPSYSALAINRARVAAERAADLADVVVREGTDSDPRAKRPDFLDQPLGFLGHDDFFRIDGDEVGQLVGRFFQFQLILTIHFRTYPLDNTLEHSGAANDCKL